MMLSRQIEEFLWMSSCMLCYFTMTSKVLSERACKLAPAPVQVLTTMREAATASAVGSTNAPSCSLMWQYGMVSAFACTAETVRSGLLSRTIQYPESSTDVCEKAHPAVHGQRDI